MQINVIRGAAATGKTTRLLKLLDEVGLDDSALIHGNNMTRAALERTIESRLTQGDTVICFDDCSEETLEWLSKLSSEVPEGRSIYAAVAGDGPLQEALLQDKPLKALRNALYDLDREHARLLDAENDLRRAQDAFEARRRKLGPIWMRAIKAGENIGEVPRTFRMDDLIVTLGSGEVSAERLPAGACIWTLTDLSKKAGEMPAE